MRLASLLLALALVGCGAAAACDDALSRTVGVHDLTNLRLTSWA